MHGRRHAEEQSCCIAWGWKASAYFILYTQGTTFDEAMSALQKHFVPKVNIVACRHTFSKAQRAKCGWDYYAIRCCFKSVSSPMCVRSNGEWNAPWSVNRKCVVDCSKGQITIGGGPDFRESNYKSHVKWKLQLKICHYSAIPLLLPWSRYKPLGVNTKYGRGGKGVQSTKQSQPAQRRSEDRKNSD